MVNLERLATVEARLNSEIMYQLDFRNRVEKDLSAVKTVQTWQIVLIVVNLLTLIVVQV